ncbi:2TM domain-containing protein [Aquimarina sp. AU474]|uniref:2TM domain-containing protein n=1 Tax=Aquimarina sp. AU474 TaxID=2108529 RepID=UPI000D695EAA|nr:2TM domain-containing protein [Aquimarina sp. AU474]
MKEIEEQKVFDEAKKRVENEKGFHTHLIVYVLLNIVIIFFKHKILIFINADPNDKDFFEFWWLGNVLTPILWGIGLLFHWLWAFKKTFLFNDKWEKKKIERLVEEDEEI